MTKLLTQNKKMTKTNKETGLKIFNFGITAVKACPSALHCVADCYATQGAYRWSNVKSAFDARFELTKTNDFVELMHAEINKKRNITHVRIHDSGDFYSLEYLTKWIMIMRDNPHVQFYAYTKEVELIKSVVEILPSNFTYIFSYGGKHDALINKDKDRHAVVFESSDDIPAEYVNASENDILAIGANKNIGLSYHGQRKFKGFKNVLNKLKIG